MLRSNFLTSCRRTCWKCKFAVDRKQVSALITHARPGRIRYTEARQVDLEAQQRRPAAAARAALDALGPIALKAFGKTNLDTLLSQKWLKHVSVYRRIY
jgi:hypothetical protein